MQAPILESIRKNLFEKRDRINECLREGLLGPARRNWERAVATDLDRSAPVDPRRSIRAG